MVVWRTISQIALLQPSCLITSQGDIDMLYSKLLRRLMDQAGDDGEGSGGNAGDDIQAKIDAAVSGLKTKNSELLGKLKDAQTSLKAFEGIDADKVKSMMARLENDDEAKLLAEGKMDEVISRRTAKRDADWQSKLDQATKDLEAEKSKSAKFLGRVLDDQVREAVTGKVHDKAIEDALFRARQIFSLNDDGVAVQLQGGDPIMGKDGKTLFSPREWIESMRESAPHWFPATGSGGGATQSTSSGVKQTMKRAVFDALGPAEKASKIKEGVKIVDA